MLKGTFTALITPFENGEVNYKDFEQFVEWQIQQGVHGLVPCGSTGESFCLSPNEHQRLIETTVKIAAGRVPVIAGAGGVGTSEVIALMGAAQAAGADAALVVTPAYVKPSSQALYTHYKTLAEAVDIPVLIYNNPGRTAVSLDQETLYRLAELPGIIGIKDSTSDLTRPILTRLRLGESFLQFSGEDATAIPFLNNGGQGWISVVSNVAPALCAKMYEAWFKNEHATALALQDKLLPLMRALFLESNPVPVKCAVSLLGFGGKEMRRPLLEACPQIEARLKSEMVSLGLF